MILSIDPGLGGGLVVLSKQGQLAHQYPMPKKDGFIDLPALYQLVRTHREEISCCVLEYQASRPNQGSQGTFKAGMIFGALLATLEYFKIPYELVTARSWTKHVHHGLDPELHPKDRSLLIWREQFQGQGMKKGPKSGKPHDGILDAFLMGRYYLDLKAGKI